MIKVHGLGKARSLTAIAIAALSLSAARVWRE